MELPEKEPDIHTNKKKKKVYKDLYEFLNHVRVKKGDKITYNHDKVYNVNKDRFESMECFKKYKSYTNTNNIPTFCRDI